MHCKTLYIGQSGGEVGVVMQSVYSLHVIVSGYQTILPQEHLRQGHTFTFFNMVLYWLAVRRSGHWSTTLAMPWVQSQGAAK